MDIIYVEWSGPYSHSDIIDKRNNKNYKVTPDDIGLYQIYGSNPIYGNNVLIYIGKTVGEEENSKFYKRLNKGRGVILSNEDSDNIQIYLGKIYYDDSRKHDTLSEDISKAESLLIHYHKPSNNSSNINSLKYYDKDYRVINTGNYRSLNKEISTTAFTKEHKLYEDIDNIINRLEEELSIKIEIYWEEDGYGFYINDNLWFGVNYELWNNTTTLVLMSNTKIDNIHEKNIDNWDHKEINGNIDEIITILKPYFNK